MELESTGTSNVEINPNEGAGFSLESLSGTKIEYGTKEEKPMTECVLFIIHRWYISQGSGRI